MCRVGLMDDFTMFLHSDVYSFCTLGVLDLVPPRLASLSIYPLSFPQLLWRCLAIFLSVALSVQLLNNLTLPPDDSVVHLPALTYGDT